MLAEQELFRVSSTALVLAFPRVSYAEFGHTRERVTLICFTEALILAPY